MRLPRLRLRRRDPDASETSAPPPTGRRRRRAGKAALVVATGLAGAVLGIMLGAHTQHAVGPVTATFSLKPSLHGSSTVTIPPLGSLSIDSHDGPLALDVRVDTLNATDAKALVDDPTTLNSLTSRATQDVTAALERLLLQATLFAVIGGLVVGVIVFRGWRPSLVSGGVALVLLVVGGGTAALTRNPQALREPRYTGLLTNAPAIIGSAQDFEKNFGVYSEELSTLVSTVSKLYATATTLPAYQPSGDTIRILHVSDLHLSPNGLDVMRSVIKQYKIQAVFDTGDLVDSGISAEDRYAAQIGTLGVPYVFVRGNHDSDTTVSTVAKQKNAIVLNDTETTVAGVTVAGIADPQFTPGHKVDTGDAKQLLRAAGQELADSVAAFPRRPDVLMVHDPAMAGPLAGAAPLVLAGHLHKREVRSLDKSTQLLVGGSTGGAGFRGLDHKDPTPLECSVLYFDATSHVLQARDDITVGGLGQSKVTVDRTVSGTDKPAGDQSTEEPSPGTSTSPTPG